MKTSSSFLQLSLSCRVEYKRPLIIRLQVIIQLHNISLVIPSPLRPIKASVSLDALSHPGIPEESTVSDNVPVNSSSSTPFYVNNMHLRSCHVQHIYLFIFFTLFMNRSKGGHIFRELTSGILGKGQIHALIPLIPSSIVSSSSCSCCSLGRESWTPD